MGNLESIRYFTPELIIVAFAILVILFDLVSQGQSPKGTAYLSLVGLLFTTIAVLIVGPMNQSLFFGMIRIDGFATFFKIIVLIATAVTIVFSMVSNELDPKAHGEYYALLIAINLGMFLMASSTNILIAYLSLETVSLTSYILAGFLTRSPRSSEAAFKYIIFGAVASGTMLFGLSLIFGMTGTTSISQIGQQLPGIASSYPTAVLVSIIFILAGVGYKIASVPFHMWSPDVYEGAPIPITAFLSVASKAAGFALFIRLFYFSFGGTNLNWTLLLSIVSALTMTFGNLAALPQQNVKRLLAYSSIAHGGYLLMGVVLLSGDGIKAILFYLTIYMFMNLGAFFVVILVAKEVGSENIDGYKGLISRAPFVAVAMVIFLFSLTGMPPLAGFAGKWVLFAAVVEQKLYWLAIIGVLNSVVSLYYYIRIVKAMLFETSEDAETLSFSRGSMALLMAFVVPTILLGVYWKPYDFLKDLPLDKFIG